MRTSDTTFKLSMLSSCTFCAQRKEKYLHFYKLRVFKNYVGHLKTASYNDKTSKTKNWADESNSKLKRKFVERETY